MSSNVTLQLAGQTHQRASSVNLSDLTLAKLLKLASVARNDTTQKYYYIDPTFNKRALYYQLVFQSLLFTSYVLVNGLVKHGDD